MTRSGRGRARPGPDVAYADTDLFIALFAGEEHPLHEPALSIFRRVADGALRLIVTPMVVAEIVYVGEAALGWSRPTTARRLSDLLVARGLEVREITVLTRALTLYAKDRRLDFADAYLAACGLELGPPRVASLDADFDRVVGIARIAG